MRVDRASAAMTGVLAGKITQLVRRETARGVIFEFWIEGARGRAAVRAAESVARDFREGDLVEVEGRSDPSGVLDAVTMTRARRAEPSLPWWLCAPHRRLVLILPLIALAMVVLVWWTTTNASGERTLLWAAAGAALVTAARSREPAARLMLQTAGASAIGISAVAYLELSGVIALLAMALGLSVLVGGIVLAATVVMERRDARGAQSGA